MKVPLTPKIGIGLAIVLILLFQFINANFAFSSAYSEQGRSVILVYLILLVVMLAVFRSKLPLLKAKAAELRNFAIMFLLTYVVSAFVIVPFISGTPGVLVLGTINADAIGLAISFGLLYSFGKAAVEEIVFRQILPKAGGLGDVWSNVLFGFFHAGLAAGTANAAIAAGKLAPALFWPSVLGTMALLGGLGFIWSRVRDRFGLLGSIGSHSAWNAVVYGVRF